MKYLISSLLFFSLSAEYVSKVVDIESFYTYKGEKLTPENLYQFAPKLSASKLKEVKNYIQKNENKFDVKRLLKTPNSWSNVGTLDILNNRLIDFEIKNRFGFSNYVFEVKELKLIFKISSFENRLWNIVRAKWGDDGFYDYQHGKLSLDKISSIAQNRKTYQTASRIAGYLVLKEALEKNNIQNVELPNLCLFTLDGTNDVSDQNVIVLEPSQDLGILLEDYIKQNEVSADLIKNFLLLIVESNLWNLRKTLYIKDGNKSVVANKQLRIFDLEQPNKTRPQDAFLVQHSNFGLGRDLEWNILSGLSEFYQILKNGTHNEVKIFQEWILNGPKKDFLKKLNGYDYFLKQFDIKK